MRCLTNILKKAASVVVCTVAAVLALSITVSATFINNPLVALAKSAETLTYTNPQTGYMAVIRDKADYLTSSEEADLLEQMKRLTEYTNIVYVTDDGNYAESESYSHNVCQDIADEFWPRGSSVVVYDCDNEYDYVFGQGKAGKTITKSKAYSITDNVYKLSMAERYYEAAVKTFDQVYALLQGRAIAEPMKYICNAFIAFFIAFIVNFAFISKRSKLKRANFAEMIDGAIMYTELSAPDKLFTGQTRTYSPRSSSGGGGGRGGHGGGGHGGGGHGGGHSH